MKINLTAGVNSTSYGLTALNIAANLEKMDHEVALWPIGGIEAPQEHHDTIRRQLDRQACYDPEAVSLRVWHQFALAQHVGKKLHAALTIFELDRLRPVEKHHIACQDIVFVPSHWAGEVLIDNGIPEGKIHYAPLGVDTDIFRPLAVERAEGEPTTFFNCGKWETRKGHFELLTAFERAFSPTDNVKLILNCYNPCFPTQADAKRYNWQWESYYTASPMYRAGKIEIRRERFSSQRELSLLMNQVDCGVFPAKAEGWNLEALEMMACGKQVILTDYSGHTEFANSKNSFLISGEAREVAHDGIWFKADLPDWNGKAGMWMRIGEVEIEQLVCHMREVHRRKQEGSLSVNEEGIETARWLTWENTTREIVSVLDQA